MPSGTTSSKEDESESLVRSDWGLVGPSADSAVTAVVSADTLAEGGGGKTAGAASWPSCVPGSLNAKYPERVVSGEKAPEAINDRTRTSSLKGGARRSRE